MRPGLCPGLVSEMFYLFLSFLRRKALRFSEGRPFGDNKHSEGRPFGNTPKEGPSEIINTPKEDPSETIYASISSSLRAWT